MNRSLGRQAAVLTARTSRFYPYATAQTKYN